MILKIVWIICIKFRSIQYIVNNNYWQLKNMCNPYEYLRDYFKAETKIVKVKTRTLNNITASSCKEKEVLLNKDQSRNVLRKQFADSEGTVVIVSFFYLSAHLWSAIFCWQMSTEPVCNFNTYCSSKYVASICFSQLWNWLLWRS